MGMDVLVKEKDKDKDKEKKDKMSIIANALTCIPYIP